MNIQKELNKIDAFFAAASAKVEDFTAQCAEFWQKNCHTIEKESWLRYSWHVGRGDYYFTHATPDLALGAYHLAALNSGVARSDGRAYHQLAELYQRRHEYYASNLYYNKAYANYVPHERHRDTLVPRFRIVLGVIKNCLALKNYSGFMPGYKCYAPADPIISDGYALTLDLIVTQEREGRAFPDSIAPATQAEIWSAAAQIIESVAWANHVSSRVPKFINVTDRLDRLLATNHKNPDTAPVMSEIAERTKALKEKIAQTLEQTAAREAPAQAD